VEILVSDGVSDAYRNASAADLFRNKWEKAQVEEILLTDLRKELKLLPTAELLHKAYQESRYLKLEEEQGWLVKYSWGDCFQQSINADDENKWTRATKYWVFVGTSFGQFHNYDQREALIDAILYRRWLKTPEGEKAVKDYND
jgi:hypothetical protein